MRRRRKRGTSFFILRIRYSWKILGLQTFWPKGEGNQKKKIWKREKERKEKNKSRFVFRAL